MKKNLLYALIFLLAAAAGSACNRIMRLDLPPRPVVNIEEEWVMLGRNPQRQHFIKHNISPPLGVVWRKTVKSVIADHPLAFGNVILAPTVSGQMYVIDYYTGQSMGSGKLGPSIQSAPSLYHNLLYAGLTLGEQTLVAYDVRKGEKELNKSYPHITTSPTVVEDKIYFGTDRNLFFCANFYSGESIWNYRTEAAIQSSPAFQSSSVIFGDDHGWLYSLEASSGIELWKIQLEGGIFSHPVVDDSLVYVGAVSGIVYAVNINNGAIVWKQPLTGAIFSSPALYQNVLYLGNNAHEVVALHKTTGEIIWKFKTRGIVNTVPLPTPDYLYVTSWDKSLYVLDRYSGKLIFQFELRSPSKSSPIIYRDYLLIHTANQELIALSNEKFVEEWRARR